eukprot:1849863-Rhodomonas_salina.1
MHNHTMVISLSIASLRSYDRGKDDFPQQRTGRSSKPQRAARNPRRIVDPRFLFPPACPWRRGGVKGQGGCPITLLVTNTVPLERATCPAGSGARAALRGIATRAPHASGSQAHRLHRSGLRAR